MGREEPAVVGGGGDEGEGEGEAEDHKGEEDEEGAKGEEGEMDKSMDNWLVHINVEYEKWGKNRLLLKAN